MTSRRRTSDSKGRRAGLSRATAGALPVGLLVGTIVAVSGNSGQPSKSLVGAYALADPRMITEVMADAIGQRANPAADVPLDAPAPKCTRPWTEYSP